MSTTLYTVTCIFTKLLTYITTENVYVIMDVQQPTIPFSHKGPVHPASQPLSH